MRNFEAVGNVIYLDQARAARKAPALPEIESYWQSVRKNSDIPMRNHINPRALRQLLSHCFTLQRIAPGMGKLRVGGQHLGDLLGMKTRGLPLSALFQAQARPRLSVILESVWEQPAIVNISLASIGGFGRPPLDGSMVLLPLAGEDGRVDLAFGGLVMNGEFGRTPRRLDILSDTIRPLSLKSVHRDRKAKPRTLSQEFDPA